jgi:hypothetical protein
MCGNNRNGSSILNNGALVTSIYRAGCDDSGLLTSSTRTGSTDGPQGLSSRWPLDMSKERARENMSSKLYDKYTLPIRNRLKITKLDLSMIEMEGVENRWPRPPTK